MSGPPSGTAVESSGIAPRTLLFAGGIAIGIGVLLAVLLTSGKGTSGKPGVLPQPAPVVEAVQPAVVEPVVVAPAAPPPTVIVVTQASALEHLRRAFAKARVYSQISVTGDQLELRSSACEDRQLGDLLEQSRALLSESGLHRVRCLQPHGQVVFTREL
jgi:hypothetical protein